MKRSIKNVILILISIVVILLMILAKNNSTSNDINSIKYQEIGNQTNMNGNVNPPEKPNSNSEPPEKINENNTSILKEVKNNSNNIKTIYYMLFGIESLILSIIIIYLIMSKFNKKTFKETFENKDKVLIGFLSVIILTTSLTYLNKKITTDYLLKNNSSENQNEIPNKNEQQEITYSAVKEITDDANITNEEYSSTSKDENAILVSGNIDATLSDIEVNKTGDSDASDNTSFYGNNSAILAKDGANLILKNINVTTDATGANGIFSYGGSATTNNSSSDNTTITISDSSITTKKDNSGGIMTTGGGIMNASNLTVNTAGTSSAAIRTDRGGGSVNVKGGTYTTTGKGSPAIYSTADIVVNNAKLISKTSEGIVIEGKNSVKIDNCELIDSNTQLNGQSTTYKNIFLYQSMSGDAENGNASFTSTNSKIATNNGDSFYVTNTKATINLENNTIVNNDENGNFLRIKQDSWGTSGSNGGDVTLILNNQKVQGNIVVDSISNLDMTMKSNSYYEGIINAENSAKEINLTLDKTSKIKLNGDSYITSLDNKDTSNSNIDFNGYKLYVNGKAIN